MKFKNTKISFTINGSNENAVAFANGIKTFCCNYSGNKLNIELYYDFRPQPLVLTAKAKEQDLVKIIILPHRIELYINGKLQDEEWCAGNCLLDSDISGSFAYEVDEYFPAEAECDIVLGEFTNAQGWKPEENVFVGDCMPYVNNGRYHVLYLKDRHHHYSKWGMGAHQWAHISSNDMVNWQIHPMAIEITHQYEGSICTGSWIKNGSKEYLFYTVRMADGTAAKICRSVSENGYSFTKDKDFCFLLSDKYNTSVARDPKVFADSDGLFHMLVTCSTAEDKKGCLVHLYSTNLTNWQEVPEPFLMCDDENEPECPDYFKYGEFYYLIYSIKGVAHYRISKQPFTDWIVPDNDIIPCSSVPKGAIWNEKIIFTGFEPENGYGGTMTFKTAIADKDGNLVFE